METMAKKLSALEGEMYDINLRCTELEKDRNNNVIELGKYKSAVDMLEIRLNQFKLGGGKKRISKKRRSKKRRS